MADFSDIIRTLNNRARDMVVEQRGHFWGSRGASLVGVRGEGPGKFLGL